MLSVIGLMIQQISLYFWKLMKFTLLKYVIIYKRLYFLIKIHYKYPKTDI